MQVLHGCPDRYLASITVVASGPTEASEAMPFLRTAIRGDGGCAPVVQGNRGARCWAIAKVSNDTAGESPAKAAYCVRDVVGAFCSGASLSAQTAAMRRHASAI